MRGTRKRNAKSDLQADHGASKRRTKQKGEEVIEEHNFSREMKERHMEKDVEPESQQNKSEVQCENCKNLFGRLMYHLKKRDHENCLNYYCDSLENLMNKLEMTSWGRTLFSYSLGLIRLDLIWQNGFG